MECPKCKRKIEAVNRDLNDEGKCIDCGAEVLSKAQLLNILKKKDGKTKGALEESGVSDISIDQRARDLNQRLVLLKKMVDDSYFEMGGVLFEIRDDKLYLNLGFPDGPGVSGFRDYVNSVLGFGWRKAIYLIGIWEKFNNEVPLKPEERQGIEWSKMKEIVPVVTQENVKGWLSKARKMTTRQLQHNVQQVRSETPNEDFEETILISCSFTKSQLQIIEQAEDIADKLCGGGTKKPRRWELIAADFIGRSEERAGRVQDILSMVEKVYKIKVNYVNDETVEGKKKNKIVGGPIIEAEAVEN